MMKRFSGFTYVELLFSVAILALLATAVMPYAEIAIKRQKETELRRHLREVRTAIDEYKKAVDEERIFKKADQSPYPSSLSELVSGVENVASAESTMLYFLRRIPRDPMNQNSDLSAEKTWGLRSSTSPPNSPAPGKDVFDIYSLNKEQGLNGVPYEQW